MVWVFGALMVWVERVPLMNIWTYWLFRVVQEPWTVMQDCLVSDFFRF